nr:hu li tai shao [Cucujiformia]
FSEELERIIETQLNEGSGTTVLMQQISDMIGANRHHAAPNHFQRNANCVLPINDIRGVETAGYTKQEKILRCKLASVYRLIDLCGWNQGAGGLVTARLDDHFLVNPHGLMYHEATASALVKIDARGTVVEQGTTNFTVNVSAFAPHAAVYTARSDLRCAVHLQTPSVVAVSASKTGLLPISQESVVIGEVTAHRPSLDDDNRNADLSKDLGATSKVLLLTNRGALCFGETVEEAFYNARNVVLACEAQLKVAPVGLDKIVLIDEETRKRIYETARDGPVTSARPGGKGGGDAKWGVGCVEFEALMRM